MKKSILFLAVASVFALASCGEKPAEVTETPVEAVEAAAPAESDSLKKDSLNSEAAPAEAPAAEAAPAEAAH